MSRGEKIFIFSILILCLLMMLKQNAMLENGSSARHEIYSSHKSMAEKIEGIGEKISALKPPKVKPQVCIKTKENFLKAFHLLSKSERQSKAKKFNDAGKTLKEAKKFIWKLGDKEKKYKKVLHGMMQSIDSISTGFKSSKTSSKYDSLYAKFDKMIGELK